MGSRTVNRIYTQRFLCICRSACASVVNVGGGGGDGAGDGGIDDDDDIVVLVVLAVTTTLLYDNLPSCLTSLDLMTPYCYGFMLKLRTFFPISHIHLNPFSRLMLILQFYLKHNPNKIMMKELSIDFIHSCLVLHILLLFIHVYFSFLPSFI